jgi:hypothetical protein
MDRISVEKVEIEDIFSVDKGRYGFKWVCPECKQIIIASLACPEGQAKCRCGRQWYIDFTAVGGKHGKA